MFDDPECIKWVKKTSANVADEDWKKHRPVSAISFGPFVVYNFIVATILCVCLSVCV